MIAQAIRQFSFPAIPERIRTLSRETFPPERDTVDLSFHSLLALSLLCVFWGFVIYACLVWGL